MGRFHYLMEDGMSVDADLLEGYLRIKAAKENLPFNPSDLDKQEFLRFYNLELEKHPFSPVFIGHPNPYTGEMIESESDYLEYLREHSYHEFRDRKASNDLADQKKHYEHLLDQQRKDHVAQRKQNEHLLETTRIDLANQKDQSHHLEKQNKDLNVQCDRYEQELNKLRKSLAEQREQSKSLEIAKQPFIHSQRRYRKIIFYLALAFSAALVVFIVCVSNVRKNAYDAGFSVGTQSGYDEGIRTGYADGYDAGIEVGKEQGKTDAYQRGYSDGYGARFDTAAGYLSGGTARSTPSYQSGAGTSRADPIADTYIGNKNSHKFHLPTCSWLPDEKNQVILESRDDAIAKGYVPCQRCNP